MPDDHVDATGTLRRLQALIACGHPPVLLAARLGIDRRQFENLMRRRGQIPRSLAGDVRTLYADLWDVSPCQATPRDRAAVAKARGYAARHRWAPPMAWDDDPEDAHWIDDPDAYPAPGWPWRPARYTAAQLAEDVCFLLWCGCDACEIAERLGVTIDTITRTIRRSQPAAA